MAKWISAEKPLFRKTKGLILLNKLMTGHYQKTVLPNGIRVVTEKLNHTRSVALGFWFTSGSRHESSRLNGISHLMEHMVFKGTAKRTAYDIAVSLEALGGQLNAFTEKEFTCFYAVVLDKDILIAVDVLSDIVQHALLLDKDLLLEREIVVEEYRNLLDSPEEYIHDIFALRLFQNHPLGAPILGTPESIQRIKRSHLLKYKKHVYSADHLIIAAAGNLQHHELVSSIEKKLCALPVNQMGICNSESVDLPQLPEIQSVQVHLCQGTSIFGYSDPRKIALLAVQSHLGSGMSSLLFQELREKRGLAYNVYSFTDFFSDTGILGIYAGTEKSQKDNVLTLIYELLYKLKKQGLSASALARAQSQMEGGLILGMEDTNHRMHRLAKMEYYLQSYVSIKQVVDAVRHLSSDSIFDALSAVNIDQNLTTVSFEPDG